MDVAEVVRAPDGLHFHAGHRLHQHQERACAGVELCNRARCVIDDAEPLERQRDLPVLEVRTLLDLAAQVCRRLAVGGGMYDLLADPSEVVVSLVTTRAAMVEEGEDEWEGEEEEGEEEVSEED